MGGKSRIIIQLDGTTNRVAGRCYLNIDTIFLG